MRQGHWLLLPVVWPSAGGPRPAPRLYARGSQPCPVPPASCQPARLIFKRTWPEPARPRPRSFPKPLLCFGPFLSPPAAPFGLAQVRPVWAVPADYSGGTDPPKLMVTQSSEGAHIQGQTPPVVDWSGTLRGGASPHWCFWGGISFLCCLPAWDSLAALGCPSRAGHGGAASWRLAPVFCSASRSLAVRGPAPAGACPRAGTGSVLEKHPWEWGEGRAGRGLALGAQIP